MSGILSFWLTDAVAFEGELRRRFVGNCSRSVGSLLFVLLVQMNTDRTAVLFRFFPGLSPLSCADPLYAGTEKSSG